MAGHTDRHDRQRAGCREEGASILDCPDQDIPVIDPRTEDDLPVELNAVITEKVKTLQNIPGMRVAEQADPGFRIGGMNGNIERGCLPLKNPEELIVIHIRQGDIVAHHHAQPPVIILDIQRIPHAFRKLVDKTEQAVIAAMARLQRDGLVQAKPERLPGGFIDEYLARNAFGINQVQRQPGSGGECLVINLVDDLFAVHCFQLFAGSDSGFVSRRTAGYRQDRYCQGTPSHLHNIPEYIMRNRAFVVKNGGGMRCCNFTGYMI